MKQGAGARQCLCVAVGADAGGAIAPSFLRIALTLARPFVHSMAPPHVEASLRHRAAAIEICRESVAAPTRRRTFVLLAATESAVGVAKHTPTARARSDRRWPSTAVFEGNQLSPPRAHGLANLTALLRPSTSCRGLTATSPRGELQRPPASFAATHHYAAPLHGLSSKPQRRRPSTLNNLAAAITPTDILASASQHRRRRDCNHHRVI